MLDSQTQAQYAAYEDLQTIVDGAGGGIRVDNVGEVDGWGFENTLQMSLGAHWDLFLTAAWADSEVSDIADLCGGEWFTRVEAYGQSDTYGGLINDRRFANDAWMDMTWRVGYRARGWEIAGYVENILDERYFDGSSEEDGIIPAGYFGPSRPRTAGLTVSWSL